MAPIRVAVGTAEALESSIWRFWVHQSEIYVAARELVRFLKLSIHSSGTWRLAYVSESDINDPLNRDDDPRVVMRWTRPSAFRPGWTQCAEILIPAIPVEDRFSLHPDLQPRDPVTWLPGSSTGHKRHLTLVLAADDSLQIEDVLKSGDQVLGSLKLENGQVAWVVSREVAMTPEERGYVEFMAADMKINYDAAPDDVSAGLMMVEENQPHPVITNIPLSWANVYVNGANFNPK